VVATIPMAVLQASTTQNDGVAGLWLVCLAEAGCAPSSSALSRALRAGTSLGLALLTKGTAWLFAPPLLLLLALAVALRRDDTGHGQRWRGVVLALAVALALALPHAVRNLDTFGFPMGPAALGSATEGDNLANEALTPALLASNVVRNAALHFQTLPGTGKRSRIESGLHTLHHWLGVAIDDPRTTRLYPESHFRLSDSTAHSDPSRTGNPLHAVLLAVAFVTAWAGARRRPLAAALAVTVVLAFVLFCAALKWQPWHSRLHLPLFVLGAPLVGVTLGRHRRTGAAVAVLLLLFALRPLVDDTLHPLRGPGRVQTTSRLEQYGAVYARHPPSPLPGYAEAGRFVRGLGCRDVGLALGWDDWEHPLWVLLGPMRRVEHVAVTNDSARLEPRRPPFAPCAIVAGWDWDSARSDLEGRGYRLAWSEGGVKVFLPMDDSGREPRLSR
jgi:4-amino-4-deoxy-L-arabinose transferase-like glycosyltransferase